MPSVHVYDRGYTPPAHKSDGSEDVSKEDFLTRHKVWFYSIVAGILTVVLVFCLYALWRGPQRAFWPCCQKRKKDRPASTVVPPSQAQMLAEGMKKDTSSGDGRLWGAEAEVGGLEGGTRSAGGWRKTVYLTDIRRAAAVRRDEKEREKAEEEQRDSSQAQSGSSESGSNSLTTGEKREQGGTSTAGGRRRRKRTLKKSRLRSGFDSHGRAIDHLDADAIPLESSASSSSTDQLIVQTIPASSTMNLQKEESDEQETGSRETVSSFGHPASMLGRSVGFSLLQSGESGAIAVDFGQNGQMEQGNRGKGWRMIDGDASPKTFYAPRGRMDEQSYDPQPHPHHWSSHPTTTANTYTGVAVDSQRFPIAFTPTAETPTYPNSLITWGPSPLGGGPPPLSFEALPTGSPVSPRFPTSRLATINSNPPHVPSSGPHARTRQSNSGQAMDHTGGERQYSPPSPSRTGWAV